MRARAVNSADGIDTGDEVVLSRNWTCELDLQIPSRPVDRDAIVLTEPVQEHDALPEHAIPGFRIRIGCDSGKENGIADDEIFEDRNQLDMAGSWSFCGSFTLGLLPSSTTSSCTNGIWFVRRTAFTMPLCDPPSPSSNTVSSAHSTF